MPKDLRGLPAGETDRGFPVSRSGSPAADCFVGRSATGSLSLVSLAPVGGCHPLPPDGGVESRSCRAVVADRGGVDRVRVVCGWATRVGVRAWGWGCGRGGRAPVMSRAGEHACPGHPWVSHAVARITWVMGSDPTDESKARRVVRPAPGSNYRLPEHGLSFTIGDHDETEAGFVTHLAASTVDAHAQAITAPPISDSDEARSRPRRGRRIPHRLPRRGHRVQGDRSAEGGSDRTDHERPQHPGPRPPQGRRPIPPSRVR